MAYQKYDIRPKTIFWDTKREEKVSCKGKNTITFRSFLEFEVYQWLTTLIGCEVICQVPIQGKDFLWKCDFMVRYKDQFGKRVLSTFRECMGLGGSGTLYIEAKGVITADFAKTIKLCSNECPNIFKNLVAFGDTPLGIVIEDGFKVNVFPIRSTSLLKEAILLSNNSLFKGN